MKRRFFGAAFAIITASASIIGGYALSGKNEKGAAAAEPLTALVRESSGFQDQENIQKLLILSELKNVYNANLHKFYSNTAYADLAAELEYELERLSELEEDGDECAARIKAINSIWGQISILAGELNSRLVTESRAEPVDGGPAVMVNNYFEADSAGTATTGGGKQNAVVFTSGFLNFLKLNNYSFSFTYVKG